LIGFFAEREEIKKDSRQCGEGGGGGKKKVVIRVLNPQIIKNTK
jgi:hypothetical protein